MHGGQGLAWADARAVGDDAGDGAARVEQGEGEGGHVQPGQHTAGLGHEAPVHAQVRGDRMQGGHIAVANVLVQRAPDEGDDLGSDCEHPSDCARPRWNPAYAGTGLSVSEQNPP
jgi:hypothetical protein